MQKLIKKRALLLSLILLFIVFNLFSQKQYNTAIKSKSIYTLPYLNSKKHHNTIKSIYTLSLSILDPNSGFMINKKLGLKSLKFVFLNISDIENGRFSVPFKGIKIVPTKYIYDSYQKAYMNINSTFFKDTRLIRSPF